MNRWKQNISWWYALGLAAILVVVSLVLATGSVWARYRTEYEETIQFVTSEPAGIYLGTVDAETEAFDSTAVGTWEQIEGTPQLNFVVANGTDAEHAEERTQIFRIRLIGGPGMWLEEAPPTIKLIDPEVHEITQATEEAVGYIAEPVRISENSLLFTTFGDGWVYYFLNEEGEELTWRLEGGVFSCIGLTAEILLDEGTQIDTGFLQLQVIGETAD